ncbi:MAG: ATP-dependent Clp protease adaptor ClpS [Bacteroidia bacterium]|nr:ATP-dependent Clp protease adaptor ClpS [Bacteroidia bacterium]
MNTKELILTQEEVNEETSSRLITWNDDFNSFQWVIQSFVTVLKHTHDQAEQCAWIIHFKGRYAVKHGSLKELTPYKDALADRGLSVTIETD